MAGKGAAGNNLCRRDQQEQQQTPDFVEKFPGRLYCGAQGVGE
jgi:hypothetical protein